MLKHNYVSIEGLHVMSQAVKQLLTELLELLHLQPEPHLEPFFMLPQWRVLHALTLQHEQPLSSTPVQQFRLHIFTVYYLPFEIKSGHVILGSLMLEM